MKFSTKISVAAVGFFLLFSQIFSLWFLGRMQEETIQAIQQQEWESLSMQKAQFSRQVGQKTKLGKQGSIYWGREALIKNFSESSVLYYEEEEIFNSTPYTFDLKKILEKQGKERKEQTVLRETIEERELLIFYMEDPPYQIVHYRDITSIYHQTKILFWKGMAVALLISVIFVIIFRQVIREILKPVYQLKRAADGFVRGNYGERIRIIQKDEIGEISLAFNHMADRVETHIGELREENEKQRRLLGSLAHELKTPMTAILGYAQTLQKVSLSPERREKALIYIEKECKRLTRLSGKMLELTSLSEKTEVDQQKLSVGQILDNVMETMDVRLKEKQLQVERKVSSGLSICGDGDLLTSFFLNLMDNACKAAEPGSKLLITGDKTGVFVVNKGKEIPGEELKKVTEPFYMADKSRARKEGGAGLGLSLCSRIAVLHGGRLVIENLPGHGVRTGLVTDWLQESEDLETEVSVE